MTAVLNIVIEGKQEETELFKIPDNDVTQLRHIFILHLFLMLQNMFFLL